MKKKIIKKISKTKFMALAGAMTLLLSGTNIAMAASNTTATGTNATASANNATALGTNSKASANNATALGENAKATGENSVALGTDSEATEKDTVSVGKKYSERRITNVEAGVKDTDAVNVKQLNRAIKDSQKIMNSYDSVVDEYNYDSSILAGSYNKIITDDDGYTPVSPLGGNVIAGGGDNEIHSSWNSAIVGGRGNHTRSYSSVIVGGEDNTMDSVISSVLLGGESNTLENADNSAIIGGRGNTIKEKPPVKVPTEVPGDYYYEDSYASDYNSSIIMGGQDNEIAFANNAAIVSGKGNSVSGDNAAVIGGEQNKASGKNAVAVGGIKTNAEGDYSVAMAGGSAKGENSFAFGDSAVAEKDKAIAFGNGASAKGEGSVALGSGSVATDNYTLSVGSDTQTRRITHVTAGVDDTDAVNVSQLKAAMGSSSSGPDDSKANITLNNITNEGKKVITDLADSVDDTAEVKAGDSNVVVSEKKDGHLATYTVKLADNITAKTFGVGGNIYISADGLNANSKRITNVAKGVNGTDAVNVDQLNEAISSIPIGSGGGSGSDPLAVKYDSYTKDTVTLKGNDGTTITNVKDGEVSKTSTDAINGSQLYETNQKVEKNASDIRDLQDADKLNVKYTNNSRTEIHLGGSGGTVISNVANATNDDEAVNYGQLKDETKNVVRYTDDSHEKAFLDGENGTVLDGVADGEISEGSMEAVNGSQLYAEQEARKAADEELSRRIGFLDEDKEYNFIKAGDSVSQNLEALDAAIIVKDDGNEISIGKDSATKVINVAGKGGEPRVITGVRTDEDDGSSAANVDFVNRKAKEGQRYSQSVGAQAAAMASLHPLDWDKNDKVSVSASVGAYGAEVAGAVGAYYRFDRKSMVSFQGAFGRNDNMFGIGFSKQLGKDIPEDEELTVDSEEVTALKGTVSTLQTELGSMQQELAALHKELVSLRASGQQPETDQRAEEDQQVEDCGYQQEEYSED